MDEGYVKLMAAIAEQAVSDLNAAHKKIKLWQDLEQEGQLRKFVEEEVFKELSKKSQDWSRISFTLDDASAVEFFGENSKCAVSLESLGIGVMPAEIVRQRDFINENRATLEKKVTGCRSAAIRKFKDKELLAEK